MFRCQHHHCVCLAAKIVAAPDATTQTRFSQHVSDSGVAFLFVSRLPFGMRSGWHRSELSVVLLLASAVVKPMILRSNRHFPLGDDIRPTAKVNPLQHLLRPRHSNRISCLSSLFFNSQPALRIQQWREKSSVCARNKRGQLFVYSCVTAWMGTQTCCASYANLTQYVCLDAGNSKVCW